MKSLKKNWPILFLAAVFLLLFYKVFFLGYVFYEGDNFHLNIPAFYFFVQQLSHGQFPLWNPYLFLGIPHFADFNLGTLNPLNILFFLFPVPRALTIFTILDFFGLSVGMYLLLRSYKLSKVASLFGAIVVSLSGVPFSLNHNLSLVEVIAYIPFIFLLAQKYCKEKTHTWLLFLIGAQFLQFVSGHPQETYYTMFFVALYLLFCSPFSFWKRIGIICIYLIFPILLSSVQLIPFLEYVQHGNRPGSSIYFAGAGGLSPALLPTFLFPTFYGSHADGSWWGAQQILVGFLGIPTLFLLYIALRFGKFAKKWFYLLGMLLSFVLAFGKSTPVFYFFFYLIPGWKLFRTPSKILPFFTFFAAIIASFGLEYFSTHPKQYMKLGKILAYGGCGMTIFSGAVYLYANKNGFWKNTFMFLQKHFHKHFVDAILFYDTAKVQQIFQGIVWNILFVAVGIFLTGVAVFLVKKKYQALLLLIFVIVGFFIVDTKDILLAPLSFYDIGKVVPSVLKSVENGRYRILSIPVNLHQERQHLPPANYFYEEGQANLTMYQYDNNEDTSLYQAGGYVVLVPASFSNFIGARDASLNVTNIDFSSVTQQQLNLSSIRYIISHEPIQNYNNIPLYLVNSQKGKQYIYENKSALPRAYILENPYSNAVSWKEGGSTKLTFAINVPTSSHLIVTNWYYPGWKAFISGKEVTINSYKNTFQTIAVPSGKSSVKIVYEPLSLKVGLVITVIACFVWIVLLVVTLMSKKT